MATNPNVLKSEHSPLWERYLHTRESNQPSKNDRHCCSPYDIVHQGKSFNILRFLSVDATTYREPILISFALVNRPYILDLRKRRSVIQQLVQKGFEVFLIDWVPPEPQDSELGLHEYVCDFLHNAVEVVCELTDSPQINLLGYCMGGTMSAIYTSLHQERVKNLILLSTPIEFSGDESLLNLWTKEEYFNVDGLIDAYGNCPGFFLQSCFQLMKPATNFVEKYVTFATNLDNPVFLDNFLAMERWSQDSVPVAGKVFREFVKLLYQQNQLTQGQLRLERLPISLSNITCPILLLLAENDHLVPPSATLALNDHVSSSEVKVLSVEVGHIGLAVSSKAHSRLWPNATDWIAEHSTVAEHF